MKKNKMGDTLQSIDPVVVCGECVDDMAIAKRAFIANISHEVRTPMNAIMGFAQMLKNTKLDDVQHGYVDVIMDSGHKLLEIIRDLLELSSLETGEVVLNPMVCDLAFFFERIWADHSSKIRRKKLKAVIILPEDLPKIIIDEVRLEKVLSLILANAIKFTGQGQVQMAVSIHETTRGAKLCIDVCDTGCGIDAQRMKSIYDIFMQGDPGITRMHAGLGLGLSIASKIVELMKGEILASSELGKGSCFKLTIPVELY